MLSILRSVSNSDRVRFMMIDSDTVVDRLEDS